MNKWIVILAFTMISFSQASFAQPQNDRVTCRDLHSAGTVTAQYDAQTNQVTYSDASQTLKGVSYRQLSSAEVAKDWALSGLIHGHNTSLEKIGSAAIFILTNDDSHGTYVLIRFTNKTGTVSKNMSVYNGVPVDCD